MSHFYAKIPTSARKTVPSARGHKSTGVQTIGASWRGAISVDLWYDADEDQDKFVVTMIPWQGAGDYKTLARGTVGDASMIEFPILGNENAYREGHADGQQEVIEHVANFGQ